MRERENGKDEKEMIKIVGKRNYEFYQQHIIKSAFRGINKVAQKYLKREKNCECVCLCVCVSVGVCLCVCMLFCLLICRVVYLSVCPSIFQRERVNERQWYCLLLRHVFSNTCTIEKFRMEMSRCSFCCCCCCCCF